MGARSVAFFVGIDVDVSKPINFNRPFLITFSRLQDCRGCPNSNQ